MSTSIPRIVITGATGALGANIIDILDGAIAEVLALTRWATSPQKVEQFSKGRGPNIIYRSVDFNDTETVARVITEFRPTVIIHCAATGMSFPKPSWFDMIRFNVDASIRLCEIAARRCQCRFIYISSGLIYQEANRPLTEYDPLDTRHPYGASKAAGDILMRAAAAEFDLPMVVIRPFSFSGPWDFGTRLFPSLLRSALKGEPFQMSDGQQVRDHIAVEDVASAVVNCVYRPICLDGIHVFNVGSGSTQTIRQLVESVIQQIDLKVEIEWGKKTRQQFEPKYLVASNERTRLALGWQPNTNFAGSIYNLAMQLDPEKRLNLKEPCKLPIRQP